MSEWQPISTAPENGVFLVERPAYKTFAVVRLYDREWGMVIEPVKGHNWTVTHWHPLPLPPPPKEAKDE